MALGVCLVASAGLSSGLRVRPSFLRRYLDWLLCIFSELIGRTNPSGMRPRGTICRWASISPRSPALPQLSSIPYRSSCLLSQTPFVKQSFSRKKSQFQITLFTILRTNRFSAIFPASGFGGLSSAERDRHYRNYCAALCLTFYRVFHVMRCGAVELQRSHTTRN